MIIEWKSIEEEKPMLGCKMIVMINDHCFNRQKTLYPVYYLENPYEPGYGFYYGDFNNKLLPDYSEVIAFDYIKDREE